MDDVEEINVEESLTPTPGNSSSRNGTANSVRRLQQPSAMHPTLIEDSESDNDILVASTVENEVDNPDEDDGEDQVDDDQNEFESITKQVHEKSGKMAGPPKKLLGKASEESESEEDDEDEDDDDDDDDDDNPVPPVEGMYDPAEYEHLNVQPEIKELFTYILRYTPQGVELETKFKPFIPDFVPAVGDIDAFIKIKRPDGKSESLGLTVLDEPAAKQSDPSVLDLQLRAVSKQTSQKAATVKKVENGEGKNSKDIEKWIKDISDLHRSKPPPTVHYTKPMPDIDYLMQEWPADVEEFIRGNSATIPTADFDCDLTSYVDIICALLDIPVYKSRIQSLHVLFTLFSAFKNSQHFNRIDRDNRSPGFDKLEL